MAKTIKKKRSDKYEKKLAVNATFQEVFKIVKKNKEDKRPKKG